MTTHVPTCAYCGKKSYDSRADAKDRARILSHVDLAAYRCVENPEGPWHLGHLASAVRHGELTRADRYRPVQPDVAGAIAAMRRVWEACCRQRPERMAS